MNIKTLLECLFLIIIVNQVTVDGSFILRGGQRKINRPIQTSVSRGQRTIGANIRRPDRSTRRFHVGRVSGYTSFRPPYSWLSFSRDPRFLIELPTLSFLCSSMPFVNRKPSEVYRNYFPLMTKQIKKTPTARLQSMQIAMSMFCKKITEYEHKTSPRANPVSSRRVYTSTTMTAPTKNTDVLKDVNKNNNGNKKCPARVGHTSQNTTTKNTKASTTIQTTPLILKSQTEKKIGIHESGDEVVANRFLEMEYSKSPRSRFTVSKESTTDLFTQGDGTTTETAEMNGSLYENQEQGSTLETTTSQQSTQTFELETGTEVTMTEQLTPSQPTVTYLPDEEMTLSTTTEFDLATPTRKMKVYHGNGSKAINEQDSTNLSYPITLKSGNDNVNVPISTYIPELTSKQVNEEATFITRARDTFKTDTTSGKDLTTNLYSTTSISINQYSSSPISNSGLYLISKQLNETRTSQPQMTTTSGKKFTAAHDVHPKTNLPLKPTGTLNPLRTSQIKKNADSEQEIDQEQKHTQNPVPKLHQTPEKERSFDVEQEVEQEQSIDPKFIRNPTLSTEQESLVLKEKSSEVNPWSKSGFLPTSQSSTTPEFTENPNVKNDYSSINYKETNYTKFELMHKYAIAHIVKPLGIKGSNIKLKKAHLSKVLNNVF